MLQSKKLTWMVLGLLVVAGIASAQEEITVDASLDYMGKYIWRGQLVTDDPVLQPAVNVGYDKFTLSVWGNMELTSVNGETQEFTEIDYTLDYTDALPEMDGVTYSLGAIHYQFPRAATVAAPNGSQTTTELYAGLGFDTILSPTVTLYHDIDEAGGLYASFGVSHSIDISEYALMDDMVNSVDLAASLGYGDGNYNEDYWGGPGAVDCFNDFVLSATLPIELCEYATLNASCNYVSVVDGSLMTNESGTALGQKRDYTYLGLGLAVSF